MLTQSYDNFTLNSILISIFLSRKHCLLITIMHLFKFSADYFYTSQEIND